MKYVVTVSGVCLADANEVLRFCAERGFGLPEIMEDCRMDQASASKFQEAGVRRRTRREIIMTVVSGGGESFSGGAVEVAKFIARATGRGVSATHMMSLFRRGEKCRGFSAIITKDSNRSRKDNSEPVLPMVQEGVAQ